MGQADMGFGFPVAEVERISRTIGFDHDPEDHRGSVGHNALCLDYVGRTFPACYDEHQGSDYILRDGFTTMDDGSATVVAAAAGRVIETEDGNYDRCRLQGLSVDCDGYPMRANLVVIEHPTGWITRYLHLKEGSVQVEVGQWVECGAPVGLIGSSGNSSLPHLHFDVQTLDGDRLDPYAGPYSQEESLWEEQGLDVYFPAPGCTAR